MTDGHVYNHFILHTQQIFTLALLISITIVFGNYATEKTATIPIVYRQEIVAITATGSILILFSLIYDLFSTFNSKIDLETLFKNLNFIHHIISFIFILVVMGISITYLNRGNIPYTTSLALSILSGLISVFTLGVIIYCFNKTLSSRRQIYDTAARNIDLEREKSLVG